MSGEHRGYEFARYQRFVCGLREYCSDSRTLVMAAGDLAHVGPEFGDSEPYNVDMLSTLSRDDQSSLAAVESSSGSSAKAA